MCNYRFSLALSLTAILCCLLKAASHENKLHRNQKIKLFKIINNIKNSINLGEGTNRFQFNKI